MITTFMFQDIKDKLLHIPFKDLFSTTGREVSYLFRGRYSVFHTRTILMDKSLLKIVSKNTVILYWRLFDTTQLTFTCSKSMVTLEKWFQGGNRSQFNCLNVLNKRSKIWKRFLSVLFIFLFVFIVTEMQCCL